MENIYAYGIGFCFFKAFLDWIEYKYIISQKYLNPYLGAIPLKINSMYSELRVAELL